MKAEIFDIMGRRPLLGVLFWSGRVIAELPIIDNVRIEVNVVSVRVVHREAHQQINRSRQQINRSIILIRGGPISGSADFVYKKSSTTIMAHISNRPFVVAFMATT